MRSALAPLVALLFAAAPASAIEMTSRNVVLNGKIDLKAVQDIADRLLELDDVSHDPIFLRINSPGGDVEAGFVLVDVMRAIRSPVECIVESKAHSMAAMLTTYCDKVYIFPHATMMFHEASYGTLGEDPQIRSKVEFNTRYLDRISTEVAANLGLSFEDYRKRIRDGWWLMAKEAVEAKAADAVVESITYAQILVEEVEIKKTVKSLDKKQVTLPSKTEAPTGEVKKKLPRAR
jgi:ATP-dependent Clp protease protease subunit